MVAVSPLTTPCSSTARGSSDGVSDRQKNTTANAHPVRPSRRADHPQPPVRRPRVVSWFLFGERGHGSGSIRIAPTSVLTSMWCADAGSFGTVTSVDTGLRARRSTA